MEPFAVDSGEQQVGLLSPHGCISIDEVVQEGQRKRGAMSAGSATAVCAGVRGLLQE